MCMHAEFFVNADRSRLDLREQRRADHDARHGTPGERLLHKEGGGLRLKVLASEKIIRAEPGVVY